MVRGHYSRCTLISPTRDTLLMHKYDKQSDSGIEQVILTSKTYNLTSSGFWRRTLYETVQHWGWGRVQGTNQSALVYTLN